METERRGREALLLPRRFARSWNDLSLVVKLKDLLCQPGSARGWQAGLGNTLLSASFLMFRLLLLTGTGKAREECAGKRVRGLFLMSHTSPEPGCHLLQLHALPA